MKEVSGGVCAPKGFRAGGILCGIKASSKKRDLALIYSEKLCTAAAVFTTNQVKAASILLSQKHLANNKLRAIIANSGNANACTGEAGMAAAKKMAELAADLFAISPSEVAVASTGVIGVQLPIAAIENSIEALGNSLAKDESGHMAALEAIMTTDVCKKDACVEIMLGDKPVRIGAMVKGSGMIHPNMATMLGFITTDVAISADLLDKALRRAAAVSFNRVTVDGDTSTNDMLLVMASGEAGNAEITSENEDYSTFASALEAVCIKLAKAMARDGEGATKLLTINVSGAQDEGAAERLAMSVASSSLVKAAMFGQDANWGRILCALGYSGISFDPGNVDISIAAASNEDVKVCAKGAGLPFSEEDAKKILAQEEIEIKISMGDGTGSAVVWGCDLTYDYVKINGDYRT